MFHENKKRFLLFQTFILFLIGLWSAFGTVLFYVLEKRPHDQACYDAKYTADSNTIELKKSLITYIKINASTSNDPIEVISNVRQLVDSYGGTVLTDYLNGYQGKDCIENSPWHFSNIFLFVLTIISTVGYGHILPITIEGKMACIFFGIIGIAIFLMYLRSMSAFLGKLFRKFFRKAILHLFKITRSRPDHEKKQKQEAQEKISENLGVPMIISVSMISIYILLGGVIFMYFEGWKLIASCYFSFITLGTIGFGEIVPGQNQSDTNKIVKFVVCSIYIVSGLAVVGMCIELLQYEITDTFVILSKKLGMSQDESDNSEDEYEEENEPVYEIKTRKKNNS